MRDRDGSQFRGGLMRHWCVCVCVGGWVYERSMTNQPVLGGLRDTLPVDPPTEEGALFAASPSVVVEECFGVARVNTLIFPRSIGC